MKIEVATKITPETARSRAREILALVHLGEDPAGARAASREIPTVAEFAKQFLEESASPPSIKPHTNRLYASNLRRLVVPAMGAFKLDAVTCADIARLHRRIGKATPTSANNERCRVKDMRHVEILEDIAENSTNEGYRLTAIRDLFDRGHGRPRQAIEGSGPGGAIPFVVQLPLALCDDDD
jgi:hypothetical protein